MNIFYNIMTIMYLVVGIFILLNLIVFLAAVAGKFNEEVKFIEFNRMKEELKPVAKELDYLDKIEATVRLINLINVLTDNEINNKFTSLSKINSKYELMKLDDDAVVIATNIFNAINSEENFINGNIVVSNEYIMKYITDEAIIKLLDKASQFNNKLTLVQ
nr:MAG TPA: hypothetical protein [Caudoviricetes sp.]